MAQAKKVTPQKRNHSATVGYGAQENHDEWFAAKSQRLTATLRQQHAEATKMDAAIAVNLRELGYGR